MEGRSRFLKENRGNHGAMPFRKRRFFGAKDITSWEPDLNESLLALEEARASGNGGVAPPPLHQASCAEVVKLLVEHDVAINAEDHQHNTALDLACAKGQLPVVRELVRNGAAVNRNKTNLLIPLQIALMRGHLEVFNFLLELEGTDVNCRNKYGVTTLHAACDYFYEGVIETLLVRGADINCADDSGMTPLHFACEARNIRAVEVLLGNGADANGTSAAVCFTPLQLAIFESCPRIVELLLDSGADPSIGYHKDAFNLACERNQSECMLLLLKKGFNPRPEEDGPTGLHYACKLGCSEVMQHLLDNGADINAMWLHSKTPLSYAVSWAADRRAKTECCNILVRHIAKLLCTNSYVSKRNIGLINAVERLRKFHSSCENEISRLKECSLHNNISFWDVLMKPASTLAIYFKDATVVQNIERCNVQETYPIYGDLIQENIHKAQRRLRLLEKAQTCLDEVLCYKLPEPITRDVLNYLDGEDLQSLIASQGTQAGQL